MLKPSRSGVEDAEQPMRLPALLRKKEEIDFPERKPQGQGRAQPADRQMASPHSSLSLEDSACAATGIAANGTPLLQITESRARHGGVDRPDSLRFAMPGVRSIGCGRSGGRRREGRETTRTTTRPWRTRQRLRSPRSSIAPSQCAITPARKEPSWLENPRNSELTAKTRPRISSGVDICTTVCRTTEQSMSPTASNIRARTESTTLVDRPNRITAKPNSAKPE